MEGEKLKERREKDRKKYLMSLSFSLTSQQLRSSVLTEYARVSTDLVILLDLRKLSHNTSSTNEAISHLTRRVCGRVMAVENFTAICANDESLSVRLCDEKFYQEKYQ